MPEGLMSLYCLSSQTVDEKSCKEDRGLTCTKEVSIEYLGKRQ